MAQRADSEGGMDQQAAGGISEQRFCVECGAELKDEAQFCTQCGAQRTATAPSNVLGQPLSGDDANRRAANAPTGANTPTNANAPTDARTSDTTYAPTPTQTVAPTQASSQQSDATDEAASLRAALANRAAQSPVGYPSAAEPADSPSPSRMPLLIGAAALAIVAVAAFATGGFGLAKSSQQDSSASSAQASSVATSSDAASTVVASGDATAAAAASDGAALSSSASSATTPSSSSAGQSAEGSSAQQGGDAASEQAASAPTQPAAPAQDFSADQAQFQARLDELATQAGLEENGGSYGAMAGDSESNYNELSALLGDLVTFYQGHLSGAGLDEFSQAQAAYEANVAVAMDAAEEEGGGGQLGYAMRYGAGCQQAAARCQELIDGIAALGA